MNKLRFLAFLSIAIFLFTSSVSVSAKFNENADGKSGSWGAGTSQNKVNSGNDGVRLGIINNETGKTAANVDVSNRPLNGIKETSNKYQYDTGTSGGKYTTMNANGALPTVLDMNGNPANVSAIKSYFNDEGHLNDLARTLGMDVNDLTSGKYSITMEPITQFTWGGREYVMTTTEMAKADLATGGGISKTMPALLQNMAKAMYLEKDDANFNWSAYKGNGGKESSEQILANMGIGLLTKEKEKIIEVTEEQYTDADETEEYWHYQSRPSGATTLNIRGTDYTYTCDTDVITSVSVSADDMVIGGGYVDFAIDGSIYRSADICMPAGETQIAYVKWHTPKTPQAINIAVSVGGGLSGGGITINCAIVELKENTPPDPTAKPEEQIHNFVIPTTFDHIDNKKSMTHTWNHWSCYWTSQWRQELSYRKELDHTEETEEIVNGVKIVTTTNYYKIIKIIDHIEYDGKYNFEKRIFDVTATSRCNISPDELVPTAVDLGNGDWQMKSAYGFNIENSVSFRGAFNEGMVGMTPNSIVTFPEFNYETYNRILDKDSYMGKLFFKENKYSTYNHRTHFTPLWFPDGDYRVLCYTQDIWTPCGLIRLNTIDNIKILGNMYDDYYVHLVEE